MTSYTIDRRDIDFVLFEHLRVQDSFESSAHKGFTPDDGRMILDEGHKLAKDEIFPTRAASDREGCRWEDGEVRVPEAFRALMQQYSEGGWISLTAGEEMGGSNVPLPIAVGVAEAIVGANPAFSTYPGLTRGVARVLENFGEGVLKDVVAKKLYEGEWLGTMCLTEAHAGTAVGDLKTTAVKNGRGYFLKGSKIFISGGEHDLSPNIVHLVLGRTKDAPRGIKGLSLFVVPKFHINDDGTLGQRNDVRCAGIEEKMGLHASATCVLNFGDNDACRGYLVGHEGRGIEVMFQLMNEARIGTGMQGLASAASAYHVALAYAHERTQGVRLKDIRDANAERVKIIEHPDVKRMLFSMKSQIEGMRALIYKASYLADQYRNHDDEAVRKESHQLLELLTPIVKSYCSDTGFEVCCTAMQVLGGYGYVRESGIEQLIRDVKVASIYEGTNGVQALDLVGRKLGRDNGQTFIGLMDQIGATTERLAGHPTLSGLAERIDAERARLREIVGRVAQAGMSGDFDFPALVATTLLTMMARVVISWLLLEQAELAHDNLSALLLRKGVADAGGRAQLIVANDEAAYLDNKVHSAAFFVRNVLALNEGLAATARDGYTGILGARL